MARENCGANFRVAASLFLIWISLVNDDRERVDRHDRHDDDDALGEHAHLGPQVREDQHSWCDASWSAAWPDQRRRRRECSTDA